MPIDFDSGGLFGKRRATKQFDLEKEDILTVSHDFSSGGVYESIYTVTTGKTFWVTDLILMWVNSTAVTFSVKFDGDFVWTENNSGVIKTAHVKFDSPFPLTSAKEITALSGHADNALTVIGFDTG